MTMGMEIDRVFYEVSKYISYMKISRLAVKVLHFKDSIIYINLHDLRKLDSIKNAIAWL